MKKIKFASLLASMLLVQGSAYAMNGEAVEIGVVVNGTAVEFEDQQPILLNDRTLLPVRSVMEALGKTVSWDGVNSRAIITDGEITLSLGIGDDIMEKEVVDGGLAITTEVKLDSVPVNINNRTCLPIRAVAEAFGAKVTWDGKTSTVIIDG